MVMINDYINQIIYRLKTAGITNFDPNTGIYIRNKIGEDEYLIQFPTEKILHYDSGLFQEICDRIPNRLIIFSMSVVIRGMYHELISNFMRTNSNFQYDDNLINTSKYNVYYLLDRHPNFTGDQKITEDMFKYLISSGLIKCNSV